MIDYRVLLCLLLSAPLAWLNAAEIRPNVVVILADDMGYGDVRALNPKRGKIRTPHLDRLAAQGMIFTDAHSGSSVCTPTRYGLLTGRYAWRTRLQQGVLFGFSPPLLAKDRLTVPALLRRQGYGTAMVGKWHLGLTFTHKEGQSGKEGESVDWAAPIKDGPLQHGFDEFLGISASLDMPPFAWIRNDRFTQAATVTKKFLRSGPAAPDFEAIDVLPKLVEESIAQIGKRAPDARKGKPFFLYIALTSPHTPIVPLKEWRGRSGLGDYGDFVMQTDAAVGEILSALDREGIAKDTLVLFTADNGCSPAAGTEKLEKEGHFASEKFRGYKADIWEGGHRVPFLVRWPARVKAGTRCENPVCLTDLLATCADIAGAKLPAQAGEDSVSLLPVLSGKAAPPLREAIVHHSIEGRFAIRQGQWKLALCAGSGGWSKGGGKDSPQLYDLNADPGETTNLAASKPEIVKRLTALLDSLVASGRSTPGEKQPNDLPVNIRRPDKK